MKIIGILVDDFKCKYCGHEEYFVVDPYKEERIICCDKCGKAQDVEYRIEWEEEK